MVGLPFAGTATFRWATRSRSWSPIFVSTSSCAPRVFHRASQGPQGRVVSTPPGGARQGPIAGYVLQSAAPTGPSPWAYEGVSSSSVYRTLVSGCEGPSIAVLCSVASRVARETQSSYLRLYHLIRDTVSEREMRTRPNTTLADRLA